MTPRRPLLTLLALFALLVAGCPGNTITEFPPGLLPLEANTAPAPAPLDGDPHPETLSRVSGTTNGYAWTHARGYLHAPIETVWVKLRVPAVVADPSIASFTVDAGVEPEYEASFVLHYTDTRVIEVKFDVTWRFGHISDDQRDVAAVAARFQKTWGVEYISLMEGLILVRAIDDGTTEIELVEHLTAFTSGTDETEAYLGAVFEQLRAAVHGP